jgi:hypothetical protein
VRLEELSPFPRPALERLLDRWGGLIDRSACVFVRTRRLVVHGSKNGRDTTFDRRWPPHTQTHTHNSVFLPSGDGAPQALLWLQEEPLNAGAWAFVQPHLTGLLQVCVSLCFCS